MRKKIKKIIGWFICKKYGIKYSTIPFVGNRINIVNNSGGIIECGNNVSFSNDTYLFNVSPNAKIQFGNNVRIAHHFQISCARYVNIKSNVNIASFVFIADHNHSYEDITEPIMNQGILLDCDSSVVIDEGTWIGTKVTIVGNVKIGKHCVIGANSVVTKDIPDFSVAAGIPCKVIKHYDFEMKKWVKG